MTLSDVLIPLAGHVGLSQGLMVAPAALAPQSCILVRTPYPRELALIEADGLALAAAGHIVVVQSIRGRHGSAGRFVPFVHEAEDGAEAVSWCAMQPWCNGKVVLVGKSYEGLAAWGATGAPHPAVVGMMLSMTASRPSHWFYEGGAFRQSFAQSWGLSLAYTDEANTRESEALTRAHARDLPGLYAIAPDRSPLLELLEGYKMWLDESALATIGASLAAQRSVPLHLVTGWNDIFVRGALKDVAEKRVLGDRLIVGPWSHDTIGQRLVGRSDYGIHASTGEFDVAADRIAWLADLTANRPNGGYLYFLVNGDAWARANSWPPPAEAVEVLLRHELAESSDFVPIRRDVRVPTPGGRVHDPLLPLAGGFPFEEVALHPGATLFSSGVQAWSADLAGEMQLTLGVRSDDDMTLVAWLAIVGADGAAHAITAGATQFAGSPDPQPVELCFSPTACRILAGSRLAVALTVSSWPEFYTQPPDATATALAVTSRISITVSATKAT